MDFEFFHATIFEVGFLPCSVFSFASSSCPCTPMHECMPARARVPSAVHARIHMHACPHLCVAHALECHKTQNSRVTTHAHTSIENTFYREHNLSSSRMHACFVGDVTCHNTRTYTGDQRSEDFRGAHQCAHPRRSCPTKPQTLHARSLAPRPVALSLPLCRSASLSFLACMLLTYTRDPAHAIMRTHTHVYRDHGASRERPRGSAAHTSCKARPPAQLIARRRGERGRQEDQPPSAKGREQPTPSSWYGASRCSLAASALDPAKVRYRYPLKQTRLGVCSIPKPCSAGIAPSCSCE